MISAAKPSSSPTCSTAPHERPGGHTAPAQRNLRLFLLFVPFIFGGALSGFGDGPIAMRVPEPARIFADHFIVSSMSDLLDRDAFASPDKIPPEARLFPSKAKMTARVRRAAGTARA
jgi:hypothetical protein